MEIESGYPSESEAQATQANKQHGTGRPMEYDSLNESKLSIVPSIMKVRAEQD